MTDDIVERLRQWTPADCWACDSAACWNRTPADRWTCESPECWNSVTPSCECTCHIHFGKEAADEIERLRTEVKRLQDFAKVDAAEIELLGKTVDALQRRCAYLVRDTPYWQVYR